MRFAGPLLYGLGWIFSLIPLNAGRKLSGLLACSAAWFNADIWKVTLTNLTLCFPDLNHAQRKELALSSLQHTAALFFETGLITHWSIARLERLVVETQGQELLEEALAGGTGVLLLVPHYGNWEFECVILGPSGLLSLYEPPKIASVEPLLKASRERSGARLERIGKSGIRALYRHLNEKKLAALLPDQTPDANAGSFAPFFGQPALTMTLAHRLLIKTGATPLLASARRVKGGFSIHYERLPEVLCSEDSVVSVTAMNQAIEKMIMRDPAQYQWEYKRFKRQPPGYPDHYRLPIPSAAPEGGRQ
ncbi:MAG: lysophospholipid acyltransferase family protein [Proteobacteria bacterium]|nr:lysophospholipid acyltransferase family protein [Pseudomonadota bacterium]